MKLCTYVSLFDPLEKLYNMLKVTQLRKDSKPICQFQIFPFICKRNCWDHMPAYMHVCVNGTFWMLSSCPIRKTLLTCHQVTGKPEPEVPIDSPLGSLLSCFLWRSAALSFHLVSLLISSIRQRANTGREYVMKWCFSYRLWGCGYLHSVKCSPIANHPQQHCQVLW